MTTCCGQPPAELLGDLVAEGLGALGVVRPDVDVDERPVLLLAGDLAGQPVDVVVVALDGDQLAAVDRGGEDLLLLQVARDEHQERMPARAAAAATALARLPVEGQASTVKPSSRAAASATATTRSLKECVGLPESSLTHRVFMPSSRGEVVGADQLGAAGVDVRGVGDVGGHRQQRRVAPDVVRAGLDLRAQGLAAERRSRTRPRAGRSTRYRRRAGRVRRGVRTRDRTARRRGRGRRRAAGPERDGVEQNSSHDEAFLSSSPRMRDGIGTCWRRPRLGRDAVTR